MKRVDRPFSKGGGTAGGARGHGAKAFRPCHLVFMELEHAGFICSADCFHQRTSFFRSPVCSGRWLLSQIRLPAKGPPKCKTTDDAGRKRAQMKVRESDVKGLAGEGMVRGVVTRVAIHVDILDVGVDVDADDSRNNSGPAKCHVLPYTMPPQHGTVLGTVSA